MPGTLENVQLPWAKCIPVVQRVLILLRRQKSACRRFNVRDRCFLKWEPVQTGVDTHGLHIVHPWLGFPWWNEMPNANEKYYVRRDNGVLGNPQELERMRFQVTGCISYRMSHLSDLRIQGQHPLSGTRLGFPAIHTCLNTQRQGHLNPTVTVWPKPHGAPQQDYYIRRPKSNTLFSLLLLLSLLHNKGISCLPETIIAA